MGTCRSGIQTLRTLEYKYSILDLIEAHRIATP